VSPTPPEDAKGVLKNHIYPPHRGWRRNEKGEVWKKAPRQQRTLRPPSGSPTHKGAGEEKNLTNGRSKEGKKKVSKDDDRQGEGGKNFEPGNDLWKRYWAQES